jgi:hypothetical protein
MHKYKCFGLGLVKEYNSPQFTTPKMQKIHDIILMGDSLIMGAKLENPCAKYTDKYVSHRYYTTGKYFPFLLQVHQAPCESSKFEGVQAQAFSCTYRFSSLNWTFQCCANRVTFFSRWFSIYQHGLNGLGTNMSDIN